MVNVVRKVPAAAPAAPAAAAACAEESLLRAEEPSELSAPRESGSRVVALPVALPALPAGLGSQLDALNDLELLVLLRPSLSP